MARVTGPLHSNTAAGQVGKSLIYETNRGRAYVKQYAKPGDRNPVNPTPRQNAIKAITRLIMKTWPTLTDEEKATWTEPAAAANIQPIALFQRANFARIDIGEPLTRTFTPTETAKTATVTTEEGDEQTVPDVTGTYFFVTRWQTRRVYARQPNFDFFIATHNGLDYYQIRDSADDSQTTMAFYSDQVFPNDLYHPETQNVTGTCHVSGYDES